MNPGIFREYDLRGIAEKDFNEGDVFLLGKAFGSYIRKEGKKTLALGRDCRNTSEMYRNALLEGLLSVGIDVLDVGVCPTPLLSFAAHHYKKDAGIIVTASHNPPQYNGFKISFDGSPLFGEKLLILKKMMLEKDFSPDELGSLGHQDPLPAYMDFIKKDIVIKGKPKVVIDAGNGTAGMAALPLLTALGCEVIPLYCEMDGNFPNHEADPTVAKNLVDLIRLVKEKKADIGIGYDGDGDRIGVVGPDGRIFHGDQLVVLFAREILKTHPGATFISEVKCSQTMYDDIRARGGNAIMWKTGHSLIRQKMKETGALLAGEMSGHMFFADRYPGYDDAIYASCRLLEILSLYKKSMDELLCDLPTCYNTPEIRIPCPEEKKAGIVGALRDYYRNRNKVIDIDGARVLFDNGWGLVRASNTEPVLVMRFEAICPDSLNFIRKEMQERVENFLH
ncbi:phosphomannomutase/phosphoglucomutase [Desulfococcaceae bacterium OttesenSCG-928-F15]|nr:phosphomannomutase/phosphoglucomutase [Desulfococcaceae bacterium OttesenSCG-928-F15]